MIRTILVVYEIAAVVETIVFLYGYTRSRRAGAMVAALLALVAAVLLAVPDMSIVSFIASLHLPDNPTIYLSSLLYPPTSWGVITYVLWLVAAAGAYWLSRPRAGTSSEHKSVRRK